MKNEYQSLAERGRAVADRGQLPIVFDGKTFLGIRDAARISGASIATVQGWVRDKPGVRVVLVGKHNVRFVRIERAPNDRRVLLYFDPDSLPRKDTK